MRNPDPLNKWLTLVANVGIIVGLFMVVYEVNQNRLLTRGELGTQQRDYYQQVYNEVSGEDIRNTLERALISPDSVSISDVLAINAYMHNVTGHIHRERLLYNFGIFQEDPADFERWVVQQYFGNEYSRIWWKQNRSEFTAPSIEVMEEEMTQVSTTRDREYLEQLQREIKGQ